MRPQPNWSEIFRYDAVSGRLIWIVNRPGPNGNKGTPAGAITNYGQYWTVKVNQYRYACHRIIWELHNGKIAKGLCIDHINGDSLDNHLPNLRLVTLSDNQRNRRLPKNNVLGIHGVQRRAAGGYAVASAGRYVGYFEDFFEACCARKSAERRDGFHPNHGRAR